MDRALVLAAAGPLGPFARVESRPPPRPALAPPDRSAAPQDVS
jgi:hypothetical protein